MESSDIKLDNMLSFTVTVGTHDDLGSLVASLKNERYFIDQPLQQLALRSAGIADAEVGGVAVISEAEEPVTISNEKKETELVAPTLEELGFSSHVRYQRVLEKASNLGLSRVSVEATLQLRFVYEDQPEDQAIVSTHKPIDTSSFGSGNEDPRIILVINKDKFGKGLLSEKANLIVSGVHWAPQRRFLFSK